MPQPRCRIFAGPNGSGKTTFYESLRNSDIIHTEIYVNADKIEELIKSTGSFNFNAYRVKSNQTDFHNHILSSGLYKIKINDTNVLRSFILKSRILTIQSSSINSYHASFIATYLLECLLETKQSFCFETVLSHPDKIKYLKMATAYDYKTYLYYLYTSNEIINIERVAHRVKQGRHFVDPELIKQRFFRSLNLLKKLMKASSTVYLIDNSMNHLVIVYCRKDSRILIDNTEHNFIKKYL